MPATRGRFNWLTVRRDIYDVIFKPIDNSGVIVIVAEGLNREEAEDMTSSFNEIIDDFRESFLGDRGGEMRKNGD